MTVKELIQELKKYPEDTKVFTEYRSEDYGITYINEPWIDFKEEVKYDVDKYWQLTYASYLKWDWIMNNVLFIE